MVLVLKNPLARAGGSRDVGSVPGSGRSSGVDKWQSTPVFLPGEFHERRSLAGHSPRGRRELDSTKWLSSSSTHISILFQTLFPFRLLQNMK